MNTIAAVSILGVSVPVWLIIVVLIVIFVLWGKRIKDAVIILILLLVLYWILNYFGIIPF